MKSPLTETDLCAGMIYEIGIGNLQIGCQTHTFTEWYRIDQIDAPVWDEQRGCSIRRGVVTMVAMWDNGHQLPVTLCADAQDFYGGSIGFKWFVVNR